MGKPITEKDLRRMVQEGKIRGFLVTNEKGPGKPGKNRKKYGNKRVEVDGRWFDSKKEAARYVELALLLKAGIIGQLECQVSYDLTIDGQIIARYVADFRYIISINGDIVVEDVKSEATRKIAKYRLKKKLMKAIYNIEIKEI